MKTIPEAHPHPADPQQPANLRSTHPGSADPHPGDSNPAEAFIRANTILATAPHVPEIQLHLATEITPIWQATENWMAENNVEPPFWAFAWPGGQALARHILDNPELVAGKRVLDFAAGGGIAAIACVMAGAASVEACEIDLLALVAIGLNAATNDTAVILAGDVIGAVCRWDLIMCGDVCYEAPMTGHIMPWLIDMSRTSDVWIADPGRAYLPKAGLEPFGVYRIETTRELEDRPVREVTLYRVRPD